MIRINLLSEGRRPVVARRAKAALSLGDQDPSLVILSVSLLLGVLVGAGLWWQKNAQIKNVDASIVIAQQEVAELEEIISQVEAFQQQQAELETKIHVIQELKQKQKGPVKIMAAISRSLPELLWLNTLRLNGNSVTLRGQAFNTNAVASFIGALNQVPEFGEPDTKDIVKNRGGRDLYNFNLNFTFTYAAAAKKAAGEGATATLAGASRPRQGT